jgi:hypothetical protein
MTQTMSSKGVSMKDTREALTQLSIEERIRVYSDGGVLKQSVEWARGEYYEWIDAEVMKENDDE